MSLITAAITFPMADSLIVYTAQQFLDDRGALMWGRCSYSLLRAMRTYHIDQRVPMVQLLCRSEGRELLPALESEEFRTKLDAWPTDWDLSLRSRLLARITAAAAPTTESESVSRCTTTAATLLSISSSSSGVISSLYSAEIGRVCRVGIDTSCLKDDRLVTRLVHLPPCVTRIDLMSYHGANPIHLPPSCTSLMIGSRAQRSSGLPTLLNLPDPGLRELLFLPHSEFNEPLERFRLPSTLHTLHLGNEFNQPVEHLELPASLTDLRLGSWDFNQPVEALRLPDGLQSLRFAEPFNHPIERLKLPSSLTILNLGSKFNHPLVEWHPPTSLTQLILSNDWQLPADQLRLPPSLLELTLPLEFNHPITDALMTLPTTLRSFESWGSFNQSLGGITQWPESLTSITLYGDFSQPMDDWTPPPQLLILKLDNYEWSIHRLRLPHSLTELSLPLKLSDPSASAALIEWPPRLLYLTLTIEECPSPECVIRNLPHTLEKLTLRQLYDHEDEIVRGWLALISTDCELDID